MRRPSRLLLACVCALAVFLLGGLAVADMRAQARESLAKLKVQVDQLRIQVVTLLSQRQAIIEERAMATSWVSGGQLKVHSSTRQTGETDAAWIERHFKEVAAEMKECPPD